MIKEIFENLFKPIKPGERGMDLRNMTVKEFINWYAADADQVLEPYESFEGMMVNGEDLYIGEGLEAAVDELMRHGKERVQVNVDGTPGNIYALTFDLNGTVYEFDASQDPADRFIDD